MRDEGKKRVLKRRKWREGKMDDKKKFVGVEDVGEIMC